jgi:hypothetical protein
MLSLAILRLVELCLRSSEKGVIVFGRGKSPIKGSRLRFGKLRERWAAKEHSRIGCWILLLPVQVWGDTALDRAFKMAEGWCGALAEAQREVLLEKVLTSNAPSGVVLSGILSGETVIVESMRFERLKRTTT